jgi:hypothetical protein
LDFFECMACFVSRWLILSKLPTNAFFNATSNKLGVGTKFAVVCTTRKPMDRPLCNNKIQNIFYIVEVSKFIQPS